MASGNKNQPIDLIPQAGSDGDLENRRISLGDHIRKLRRGRNWSLAQLSSRSGIATSTLSKVENNNLSLTYDRLCSVAEAFDLSLPNFLARPAAGLESTPTGRFALARLNSGEVQDTDRYRYEYLCVSLTHKHMVPVLSKVKARTLEEFGPLSKHSGEEFTLVLKGRVEVHTEFYKPETLEVGESVYFDSRMGHAYLNVGNDDDEAMIVSITCISDIPAQT